MAEIAERIGARIKAAREAAGMSQTGLARALPGTVSGDQVSRWERGRHRPNDDTLHAIAKALKQDFSYFIASEPDKSSTPDLMGSMNGDRSQLDRIEEKLDRVLRLLEEPSEIQPPEPGPVPRPRRGGLRPTGSDSP